MHYRRWRKYGDPLFVKQHNREHGTTVDLAYIKSQCVIDDETGCWLWQKSRDTRGYGQIGIDGKTPGVHRVAWELENGPVPEGLYVLHNCYRGKHGCCNPDHLRLGTHKENMNDHDCTGDRHWAAVVPDCIVDDIKRRYRAGGVFQRELVEELKKLGYPTTKSTVNRWCRGELRSHEQESPPKRASLF